MRKAGFIGCGNMGSAMIRGILEKGIFQGEELLASHLTDAGARTAQEALGVEMVLDNRLVAKEASLLFLAVKPQFYAEVLEEIRPVLTASHLLVGLAPGKTTSYIKEAAGGEAVVARFMPNTPARIGKGMTAICLGEDVSKEQEALLVKVAESFGRAMVIPERLMDAAGAVGGCSPAYVYMFIEAMADAAVREGMPRPMAYQFAAQAVMGSASMVLESGLHPGALKDQVTSPAGTTIEGVRVLEQRGFRSAVMDALIAASEKGKGL